jgi:ComEC/Rec2-related protein
VPLALSVALGQVLAWVISGAWAAGLLAALGLVCIVARSRGGVLVVGCIVGLVSALAASSGRPQVPTAKDVAILGTVHEAPRRPRVGAVLFVLKTEVLGKAALVRCRAVDLPWRNAALLDVGSTVVVRGDLTPVTRPRNPFSWDGWLWRKEIAAECHARFISRPLGSQRNLASSIRAFIKDKVQGSLGESVGSGLFLAMSLGYQDLISVQHEKTFMALGLTHLLVVSGYQVSLMFGCMVAVASRLSRHLVKGGGNSRVFVGGAALAAASFYVYCIGMEMSAVRAWVAAACVAAQFLSDRTTSFWQRWGVALLLMQLAWPWCVFDMGVILTFAALAGIGMGAELGAGARLSSFIAVNCCVWLCTSLVILVWRGTLSPTGLLLNLLIAAPWSVANCTFGLSALALLLLDIPGAAWALEGLSWINSLLATMILEVGEGQFQGWTLGASGRILVATAMLSAIIFASKRAYRAASLRV